MSNDTPLNSDTSLQRTRKSSRTQKLLMNMVLVMMGTLFALIIAEGAVRLLHIDDLQQYEAEMSLIQYNTLLGWTFIPNNEALFPIPGTDEYNEVIFNSWGFRDQEHPLEKKPSDYRIIILGDSFTAGLAVSSEHTYVQVLSDCLNQAGVTSQAIEVIGMGVEGYSTAQEYALFIEHGLSLEPDLVLLQYFNGNDLVELAQPELHPFSYRFGRSPHITIMDNQILYSASSNDSLRSSIERFLSRNSLLYQMLKRGSINAVWEIQELNNLPRWMITYTNDVPGIWGQAWNLTETLIQEMQRKSHESGAEFALFSIPTAQEVEEEIWTEFILPFQNSQDLLNRFATEERLGILTSVHNIPFLNLGEILRNATLENQSSLYLPDFHWNIHGHAVAGEAICAWLQETDLVPN